LNSKKWPSKTGHFFLPDEIFPIDKPAQACYNRGAGAKNFHRLDAPEFYRIFQSLSNEFFVMLEGLATIKDIMFNGFSSMNPMG
jgi:hypothetical protein